MTARFILSHDLPVAFSSQGSHTPVPAAGVAGGAGVPARGWEPGAASLSPPCSGKDEGKRETQPGFYHAD